MTSQDQIQGWKDHERFPHLKRQLEQELNSINFMLKMIEEGGRDGQSFKTQGSRLASESFEKTKPIMDDLRMMKKMYDDYLGGIGIIFTNYGYALTQLSPYTNHGNIVQRFLNDEKTASNSA